MKVIDSTLRVVVDNFSTVDSVNPQFYYGPNYSVVSLKFFGIIPAHGESTINFRIMKEDYSAWDCSQDYSFQTNVGVQEPHYKMAVYDSEGRILWGSDPFALQHDSNNIYWQDRLGTSVISQYNGLDSAKHFKGRFWLLKGSPFSIKERQALDSVGVKLLETTRYQNKGLHLLKAVVSVSKKTLSAILNNFYNALDVNDTSALKLDISSEDLYNEKKICINKDSCPSVVSERSDFNLVVECWPDVQLFACKNIIHGCGGDSTYIDRSIILTKIPKKSIQCLETNVNVKAIHLNRQHPVTLDNSRETINISPLQNDPIWQKALQVAEISTNWLNGANYTGEGIVVGVYDTGIDFSHPGFNEKQLNGNNRERKDFGYDNGQSITSSHGTHVAGIIGGNGQGSSLHKYRGIAPKVLFQSGGSSFDNQRGHVTNHSHISHEEIREEEYEGEDTKARYICYYGEKSRKIDHNIFYNWKLSTDKGDLTTKAVVVAAANNGLIAQYGSSKGFHSILVDAKNPITVGALDDLTLRGSSSLGPTWDGRIKPDIMAPGTEIISSVPYALENNYYIKKSGTSMAAPHVSGIIALMYQAFQKQTKKPLDLYSMRNSTVKALLIHSAIDMIGVGPSENPDLSLKVPTETPFAKGPDFATGWGRVDAKATLNLIIDYNVEKNIFAKFREFAIHNKVQKRWTITVPSGQKHLRTTLVWDDAPGNPNKNLYMETKLINDLDLYLVSPSGKIHYPWRIDPLPTQNIDREGNDILNNNLNARKYGLERITYDDATKQANRFCPSIYKLSDNCFDRLNNVEVVDVDNPETGVWQVVAKGYRVETGNSAYGTAQIASIVCDLPLTEPTSNGNHPYQANMQTTEILDLGDFLEHYVTFGPETSLGEGDHIYLYDGWGHLIGDFTGNSLANQRILVKTRFLQIVLDSDNDQNQGWGYTISKIENIPYGILQVLFSPYKEVN